MATKVDRSIDYHSIIEQYYHSIHELYLCYEDRKPVLILDLTVSQLHLHFYAEFINELTGNEQKLLAEYYDQALLTNQFVVFIRDGTGTLRLYSLLRNTAICFMDRSDFEFDSKDLSSACRIRRAGGGRKLTEEKYPSILTTLEHMLADEVAGDPMTEQKVDSKQSMSFE
jgi:hypothetical protein